MNSNSDSCSTLLILIVIVDFAPAALKAITQHPNLDCSNLD